MSWYKEKGQATEAIGPHLYIFPVLQVQIIKKRHSFIIPTDRIRYPSFVEPLIKTNNNVPAEIVNNSILPTKQDILYRDLVVLARGRLGIKN